MVTAMAAQPAPGVFTFLKHGVVFPASRCGLFLRVFSLNVVLSLALHLFAALVVSPLNAAVNPEDYGSSPNDIAGVSDDLAAADTEFSVSKALLLLAAGSAYFILYLAVVLAKKVAAATAAAAACSGEPHHTLGSLLREVRGNLLRCSATILLGGVLRAACAAAAFLALPVILYLGYSPRLFLLDALFAILAFQFYFYLDAVCAMAVAVAAASAAEPGTRRRGGIRAVARAWRLMRRGTGKQALVYVAATWALDMAAGAVGASAVGRLPRGTDRVVVLLVGAGLKYVMSFVVDVISTVAITSFYFECRKEEDEEKAGHID